MKHLLAFCVITTATLLPAHAFSTPGHQAIAVAAMELLNGTPTAATVRAILGTQTPQEAATWLDDVRERHQFPTDAMNADAKAFEHAMPHHGSWHFCNFPVGSSGYSLTSKYASENDVVHALEQAVAVLEGAPSGMTKAHALRTVFHLVGDIHQPLHCVTGWYDLHDKTHPVLLRDVADPHATPEDRGGNQLFYTQSQELHAMWDRTLPALLGRDANAIATTVIPKAKVLPATPGDYHHWPEIWATDTMRAGSQAYEGIRFTSAAFVPDPRHAGKQMLKIMVELPGGTKGYVMRERPVIDQQVTMAAAHLAQLLSAIHYK